MDGIFLRGYQNYNHSYYISNSPFSFNFFKFRAREAVIPNLVFIQFSNVAFHAFFSLQATAHGVQHHQHSKCYYTAVHISS